MTTAKDATCASCEGPLADTDKTTMCQRCWAIENRAAKRDKRDKRDAAARAWYAADADAEGIGVPIPITADTVREAAEAFVAGCVWGEGDDGEVIAVIAWPARFGEGRELVPGDESAEDYMETITVQV